MLNKSRLASIAALGLAATLQGAPALAGTQTWNFNDNTQNFSSNNYGNSLSLTSSDGINLTVTAWSDTTTLVALTKSKRPRCTGRRPPHWV